MVADAGDGIAHVEGLPSAMANELLEFPGGIRGLALNLDVREIGVVILGDFTKVEEGQQVRRTGEVLSVPVGDAFLGRVVDPLGEPLDGKGEIEGTVLRALELQAPSVVQRSQGERAAADRHQGDRRDDPDRARPARADHRRPADRQDRHRHRHDHQPEGQLGVRRPGAPGQVHLRGGRPEGLHHRPGAAGAGGRGRDGVHHHRRRPRLRPGRLQVHRPLHRVGDRPALDVRGPARADHLRRPVQAGRGVPGDLAAAAPPAGPRGLPGRRLLPALPAAGAVRQAVRRAGRRLADRPADHRDQGQRHLRLHPDQRHLDHRRPDLPGDRPVQLRRAARPSTSAGRCPGSAATRRSRR